MNKLDIVYDIVKQQPVLPIDVSSKLNIDSFLAKAFLDQLVEANRLKATSEKIGGVSIYYVAGQEIAADAKLKKLLGVKPTAKTFAASVPQGALIEQKRAEFLARLKEIEAREIQLAETRAKRSLAGPSEIKDSAWEKAKAAEIVVKPKKEAPKVAAKPKVKIMPKPKPKPAPEIIVKEPEPVAEIAPKVEIIEVKEKLEPEKPEPIVAEKEEKPSLLEQAKKFLVGESKPSTTVVDDSMKWLAEKGAEIISKELKKKGKEAVITASIPSSIGPMKFLVFVVNKKSIAEADLSVAYSEGVQKKYPVIVMSKGKLNKAAQKYLDSISNVVKYKQLE